MKLLNENGSKWWRIMEDFNNSNHSIYQSLVHDFDDSLTIFLFNEKKFPSLLSGFAIKG